MTETQKKDLSQPLTAQRTDDSSTLLPLLVISLVLITVGYATVMMFV